MSNLNHSFQRSAGVLLHPTALPSKTGIGNLGKTAKHWIDFLASAGFRQWQLLPLGPTGYGDSPYQTFSVFAGNPFLIDWDPLLAAGWIKPADLNALRRLPNDHVDFGDLSKEFWPSLKLAFKNWTDSGCPDGPYGSMEDFRNRHSFWLAPYCQYLSLKNWFSGKPWYLWPKEFQDSRELNPQSLPEEILANISFHEWTQYLFFGQWNHLKGYALDRGIELIGDMPIFAAIDSADAWSFPEIFQLDNNNQPTALAGVPGDGFSPEGQFWGNPLYDWGKLAETGYKWWLERLKVGFECFNTIRIDHFRGLESYWAIPAGTQDARKGTWMPGPGIDFFQAISQTFPEGRLIAEDLGVITPEVLKLKEDAGLPGMAVLQFAFGGANDNFYLPHNIHPDTIIYTGTHDNETSAGWYHAAPEHVKDHFRRYFRVTGDEAAWDLIRAAYSSVAVWAIFPLQDLMSLGNEARFNFPGVAQGNWSWRFTTEQIQVLARNTIPYIKQLNELYRR